MQIPRRSDGTVDLEGTLALVRAAAERLRPHARETPCVRSYTFSEGAGTDVWLKLENLQRTGSFKLRGSLNKVLSLEPERSAAGLVAASAGNHAQGVALAARIAGVPATVVMPRMAPVVKIRRTQDYGAEVVRFGESWDEAMGRALEIARDEGRVLVHPFDDPDVVLGQATVGLELLEQMPDVATVLVPTGGGGLLSGIALTVRALAPRVRVVGVQATAADALARAFHGRAHRSAPPGRTIADGIRVGTPGEVTAPLVRELVDDVVTVEDPEIEAAVVETLQKSKVLAEPAGVAGVAALASGRVGGEGPVCAVLSGGNVDFTLLGRMIESQLAKGGFTHSMVVRLPDAPGQLRRVLDVLAETESNLLDVQHYRAGWKVPLGSVDVEMLLETRHANEGAELEDKLRASGFEIRDR